MTNNEEIKETEAVVPSDLVCGDVVRVCDPEYLFEMIEQCKICGKCV